MALFKGTRVAGGKLVHHQCSHPGRRQEAGRLPPTYVAFESSTPCPGPSLTTVGAVEKVPTAGGKHAKNTGAYTKAEQKCGKT